MPQHPEADKDGYVFRAAVDENEEMVEMLEASRQYQNNVEVVSNAAQLDDAHNFDGQIICSSHHLTRRAV